MIDMHVDTISKVSGIWRRGNLMYNRHSVDVYRLEEAGALVEFFSTFFFSGNIPKCFREAAAFWIVNNRIDVFEKNVRKSNGRLVPIRTWEDIEKCQREKKVGGLLTIEDGVPIGNSLEKLQHFYNRGIRLMTLTWNYENAIGYPNSQNQEIMLSGLKPFGFEVLEKMNQLGMIVDVSHLSDGGFWDVVRHAKKPFVASHSNARSLTLHPRNLTDAMIEAIAEKGGVIGLNFCPSFLGNDQVSSISNMLRHIKHIYQVGGEDVLALGTDFDGISGKLQISSCDDLFLLRDALKLHKMPERVIDKMWQGNALRVLKDIL